ncbi:MAG: hypothetical protein JRF47_07335, partial [Deltaproteobacteria bacterium]|nr:hypothetical protein [Deltaproteobacteria bacterium]
GVRVARYGLRGVSCGLRVARCGLRGAGPSILDLGVGISDWKKIDYGLRVARYGLRVASCALRVTGVRGAGYAGRRLLVTGLRFKGSAWDGPFGCELFSRTRPRQNTDLRARGRS